MAQVRFGPEMLKMEFLEQNFNFDLIRKIENILIPIMLL